MDKKTPTLLVYSGSPLGNAYVLSVNFSLSPPENDTYKFRMDARKLLEICLKACLPPSKEYTALVINLLRFLRQSR